MKWNSLSDQLPQDNEEVLINWHGEYHLAHYNSSDKCFVNRFDKIFKPDGVNLMWMRLSRVTELPYENSKT
jgi:hypothetical protein